jgi:hemin uptake protein HemP
MNTGSDPKTARRSGREPLPVAGECRTITVTGGRIDSRDLFVDRREITVTHGADIYRLRLTAQNKLILTK